MPAHGGMKLWALKEFTLHLNNVAAKLKFKPVLISWDCLTRDNFSFFLA